MAYTGKNWDISSFVATPSNVAALEKDAEQLFLSVRQMVPVTDAWNNWIGHYAVNYVTATINNNTALVRMCDLGFSQLRNASSWKLRMLSMVILSAQFTAVGAGFGVPGKSIWDVVKESGIGDPRTADEKRFFDSATLASSVINFALDKALKKALGKA